jgi:hypothetical protein
VKFTIEKDKVNLIQKEERMNYVWMGWAKVESRFDLWFH